MSNTSANRYVLDTCKLKHSYILVTLQNLKHVSYNATVIEIPNYQWLNHEVIQNPPGYLLLPMTCSSLKATLIYYPVGPKKLFEFLEVK